MRCRVVAVMLGLQAAGAVPSAAQGLTLVPSIGSSIVYDDNLFQRPAAEGDLSVRFSPSLDVARRSQALTLTGRFSLSAARYARHPELTTARAREEAAVDARYAASRRLSIATASSFTATETPAELNGIAVLTPGRARARRVMAQASATYSVGARSMASGGYLVLSDTVQGGVSVTTHTATSSLERQVSARSGVRVEFVEQHFLFGTGQANASRAMTAEWTRDLSRGTTLTFRAGPRVTAGVVAPDLAATVLHAQRSGTVALSYQQTQTTVIGLNGIADIRGVTAAAERELRPRIRVRASSGVLQTRQPDGSSVGWRVAGACTWRLTDGVSAEAAYDADVQRGTLYPARPAQNIRRTRAMVSLVVARTPGAEGR